MTYFTYQTLKHSVIGFGFPPKNETMDILKGLTISSDNSNGNFKSRVYQKDA